MAQGNTPPLPLFALVDGLRRRPRDAVFAICPNPVKAGLSVSNPFGKVGALQPNRGQIDE
jgi:hypothetical protein